MIHYIKQYCPAHGEWDMDLDNLSECPKCEELGLTEVQQLRARLQHFDKIDAALRALAGFIYRDGSLCWCHHPPTISIAVHSTRCQQAREALDAIDAERGK